MNFINAPVVVSVIVLCGFGMLSFLAMKPEVSGVSKEVVLYLLGAWSTLAAGVVNYWVGSSAGSSKKDEIIAKKDDTIQNISGVKP